MSLIKKELEKARKRLLDLTTRNRLLSIPQHSRTKIIHVEDELSDEIMRLLVHEKKRFTFLEKPGSESDGDGEDNTAEEGIPRLAFPDDEDLDGRGVAARHRDTKLQTVLSAEVLQRRLLTFHHDARTAVEEQGVNTLFLALGQLQWREDKNSDIDRFAPLLLISVELERTSARDRFKLKVLDQEPSDNLSLIEKLNEFGIKSPQFEWSDDFSPSEYFDRLDEAIKKEAGWTVHRDKIVLGFFSFAKFLMYRDLDPENWPGDRSLDSHELIGGLVGEGFPPGESDISEDSHLDTLVPVERLNHVVDSDTSQALAIEEVRANRDIVIQGPPGTGKSQTITNLIATAVLDGKRVLFVAEKLAALEVVKRRMERIGLAPLVLELHSHKANKRAVLEDLKRTLNLGRPKNARSQDVLERLQTYRDGLNTHADLLNRPVQPSGFTPIQIMGKLTLNECSIDPDNIPHLQSAETWTPRERVEREQLVEDIVSRLDDMGDPSTHPWRGVELTEVTMFDNEQIAKQVDLLSSRIQDLKSKSKALADSMNLPVPPNMADARYYAELGEHVSAAPALDRRAISSTEWFETSEALTEVIEAGREHSRIHATYSGQVIDAAWSTDLTHIRLQIAAHGQSLFRFLKGGYRTAVAEFRSMLTDPNSLKEFSERLTCLDEVMAFQKHTKTIIENEEVAAACFGNCWEREKSKWEELNATLEWVRSVQNAGHKQAFFKMVSAIEDTKLCGSLSESTKDALQLTMQALDELFASLKLNLNVAFGHDDVAETPLNQIVEATEAWASNTEELSSWAAYQDLVERGDRLGLAEITRGILSRTFRASESNAVFHLAYFRQLYQKALSEMPDLSKFDGHSHDLLVGDFRETDKARIDVARWECLTKHHEGVPREGGMGAVGILKGEMNKQRGHMAIRKLLSKTGTATQSIKPVFMMSPLSVAQFLEPGGVDFDLVIFDEASQVEPVDALGAVARGKQLVVVGDERQLPPTRFFARYSSDEDDEEDDESTDIVSAGDLESILGLAISKGFRSRMLRWHYRSRHQSLIAVSNHEFYENNLFIIPSPHSSDPSLGLRFNFVAAGVFDRGKSKRNAMEAKAVAKAVMTHAKDHPKRSLGVAAFSVSQRDAIIDELELLRRTNPDLERFCHSHPHEPFFVKNLENVQGDERDIMFISVGYAKDASGYFAMNFGPLNRDGGERRLNVLISRAKERCEVFSSIRADDIDLNRSKAKGVASLKTFLTFAEKGILGTPDPHTDREMDSPFEESVKRALEGKGYSVHHQVGTSGFFIDLAVVDPDAPGRYVLGVECDGATYHSARSARERDRQRQAVLEDHGWTIHRIWSTDWFKRPNEQLAKVIEAIEEARRSGEAVSHHTDPEPNEPEIDREDPEDTEPQINLSAEPYVEADFSVNSRLQIHEMECTRLAKHVLRVVETETPIHRDEVVTRIREAWGLAKAGSRIRDAVRRAISYLASQNTVTVSDEFVHLPNGSITIRDRSNVCSASLRKPNHLPPDEIQLAIVKLVEVNHGVENADIAVGVGRLLGFSSTSQQLRAAIEANTKKLLKAGQIYIEGDFVKAP